LNDRSLFYINKYRYKLFEQRDRWIAPLVSWKIRWESMDSAATGSMLHKLVAMRIDCEWFEWQRTRL